MLKKNGTSNQELGYAIGLLVTSSNVEGNRYGRTYHSANCRTKLSNKKSDPAICLFAAVCKVGIAGAKGF